MKRIIYILALAVTAAAVISCNKWLDETPVTTSTLDDLHGETAMRALVTGAISPLKILVEQNSNLDMAGTDEHKKSSSGNSSDALTMDNYMVTSSSRMVENAWTNCYAAIQNCNIAINRTRAEADTKIKVSIKNNIIAQARFIRAYSYFKLVQWFGPVPLVTEETEAFDKVTLNLGRAPVKDVYELIVSDLVFASTGAFGTTSYLADKPSDAMPSKAAAKALLAKVYLTMGTSKERLTWNPALQTNEILTQYADLTLEAEDYYRLSYNLTSEIINSGLFALNKVFLDNFSIHSLNKFTNGESLWELPFSSQYGYGSNWSKMFGCAINGGNNSMYSAMGGRKIFSPVPNFWSFFKQGDLRRRWSYCDQLIAWQANPDYPNSNNNPLVGILNEKGWMNHSIAEGLSESGLLEIFDGSKYERTTNNLDDLNGRVGIVKYRWGTGDYDLIYRQLMLNAPTDVLATNVVVLRYADVILMNVEADLLLHGKNPINPGLPTEVNCTETSTSLMNKLIYRARGNRTFDEMVAAGINIYGDVTATAIPLSVQPNCLHDYDQTANCITFNDIMRERACELCFEFHRWNDLVRWGVLIEKYATRISNTAGGDPKVSNYLNPVPLREIQASHNKTGFYQNPQH